jgi:hypothetical protein
MTTIIELLTERNNYLQRFVRLNDEYLKKFRTGDYDLIDDFYNIREGYLQNVNKAENHLSNYLASNSQLRVRSGDAKSLIRSLLVEKDELVKSILDQDLEVLSLIDNEKSQIIRELKAIKNNKKGIKGYHLQKELRAAEEEL